MRLSRNKSTNVVLWIFLILTVVGVIAYFIKKKKVLYPRSGSLNFDQSTLQQGADLTGELGNHMWDGYGGNPVTVNDIIKSPAGSITNALTNAITGTGVTGGIRPVSGAPTLATNTYVANTPGVMPGGVAQGGVRTSYSVGSENDPTAPHYREPGYYWDQARGKWMWKQVMPWDVL